MELFHGLQRANASRSFIGRVNGVALNIKHRISKEALRLGFVPYRMHIKLVDYQLFVANPSNQALSFCRKPFASSALCPGTCPFEYAVSQILGQSALDADGFRQNDNSAVA